MSKTIVLIDDDADDLEILREAISQIEPSAHCISFIYPDEAIRVICNELIVTPDFIFTDINMPRMAGDKCINILRNNREFDSTIITVLSTTIPTDVAEALTNMGANYAFEKPSNMNTYYEMLSMILNQPNDAHKSEKVFRNMNN
jgi:CheY-like chemotaxis protein